LIISTGADGNFMLSDHTVTELRKSLFIAPLRARNLDPLNTPEPSSYLLANATKQAKKILAAHEPLPVSDDQRVSIKKLIEEARLYINRQTGG